MIQRLYAIVVVAAFALVGSAAWAQAGKCGGGDAVGKSGCAAEKAHDSKGDKKTSCAEKDVEKCPKDGKSCCTPDGSCGEKCAAKCATKAGKVADKKAEGCCSLAAVADPATPALGGGNGDPKRDAEKKNAVKGDAEKKEKKYDGEKAAKSAYRVGANVKDFSAAHAVSGEPTKLSALAGSKATVLIFWNQNCPYVKEMEDRVAEFHKAHEAAGVKVVAVDAGVNNSAEIIKQHAATKPFPILVNADSKIAARFGATRTPEVFILDADMKVRYHGAFDSGELKKEGDARKTYVADAVKALAEGKDPEVKETRAFGCTVKYAKGVEPLK